MLDDETVRSKLSKGLPGLIVSALGNPIDGRNYYISAPLGTDPSKNAIEGSIAFRAEGSVRLGSFYLNQSAYGGMLAKQGIGKKLLSNLSELLQQNDIPRITLETEKMGAYYWARAGFMIDVPDAKQDRNTYMIETGIDYLSIPEADKNALKALLQPPEDPKRFWRIADTPYGLELLKDIEYKAVLDFTIPEAKARFEDYTTRSRDQERAVEEAMAKATGHAR